MEKTIKLELQVPGSLSDITLEQYQKYFQILESIDKDGEDADMFISLKALEIFCGLELRESYKLPISHFDNVLTRIAECLNEETPLVKRFWLRGTNGVEVEFGMNPDLSNLTFGEYVDLDSYISDWKQMHKAMAVLFRPITAKSKDLYEIEEYESSAKYADHMKYMPANAAIGAIVFFYRLGTKLSEHMTDSLLNQAIKDSGLQVVSKSSDKSGDGTSRFTQWLQEILPSSKKSQN